MRILATLLTPDSGTAEVAGVDVLKNPWEVRRRIGLSGQYAAVDEYLTGFENLDMIGRLYHLGRKPSRDRARELLAQFRLEDAGDWMAKTYSGGMRRHLAVADHPVPRGGGCARGQHRGDRPRQGHRGRHGRSAQGAGRRSFVSAVGDGFVVAKRNLINIKRVPDLLVFTTLQPIMFVLLFVYVFGGAIAVKGSNYKEFLIAGIFAQTVIFGSVITGAGLAEDIQKGIIDRFRSLPMSSSR